MQGYKSGVKALYQGLTILFIFSMFLLFPKISSAATINAASCSASAVQAAINSASDWDTVSVPAGSCTWSSKIPLNKKISIIGAGMDNTIITGHGFNVANGTNNWRISGFTFSSSSVSLAIQVGASRSSIGCRNFRIDNNKFIGYGAWIQVDGHSTGVIDHNQFLRNSGSGIYVFGDDEAAWTRDTGLGMDDFVFIEDNTFDTNGVSNLHFILANFGARMVVRYNTMKESGGGNSPDWIDTHGYCHGSFERGTRAFEIYGNKLIRNSNGCCRGLFLRGGTGIAYNNTFNEANGKFIWDGINTPIFLVEYRASQWSGTKSTCSATCSTSQWCSTGLGGEGAPCCDQIGRGKNQQNEPLYLWGNVDHNNSQISAVVHAGSQNYIRSNIDYFTTQKANYTPYTYPHPLSGPAVSILHFSSDTYSVSESSATATITVTRAGSSAGAVSVNYATTTGGTATAGSDYTAVNSTLSWLDGETGNKQFIVSVTDDVNAEDDETIKLTLSSPNGAILVSPSTATLTILDNDGPATLRFENSSYNIYESSNATIGVRRTGSSAGAVSVNYATSNGTATAGSDYTSVSGVLNWVSGDTATKFFTVPIINDTVSENSESIILTLSNPAPIGTTQIAAPNPVELVIAWNDSNPNPNPNPNPDSNITTNSSAVDAEVQGGGCGFVKGDDNGKGPRANGGAAAFAMMLIMTLAGIAIARRIQVKRRVVLS